MSGHHGWGPPRAGPSRQSLSHPQPGAGPSRQGLSHPQPGAGQLGHWRSPSPSHRVPPWVWGEAEARLGRGPMAWRGLQAGQGRAMGPGEGPCCGIPGAEADGPGGLRRGPGLWPEGEPLGAGQGQAGTATAPSGPGQAGVTPEQGRPPALLDQQLGGRGIMQASQKAGDAPVQTAEPRLTTPLTATAVTCI